MMYGKDSRWRDADFLEGVIDVYGDFLLGRIIFFEKVSKSGM